ncbi:MAG: signal recognition particle protein [Verrucomicrobiales bacterium]
MFQDLSQRFQAVVKNVRGHGKLTEANVNDAVRQIRMALLDADVPLSVVKSFTARVKEKALGEDVLRSVTPGQQFIRIFHQELSELLGDSDGSIRSDHAGHIMIVGLNGSGKTTSTGKLALYLKKMGRTPAMIACDMVRPAAMEQLQTLGEQVQVPVFRPEPGETNMVRAARAAKPWIEGRGAKPVLFDTAGRMEERDDLMHDLVQLKDFIRPSEIFLVADAATGQKAIDVAKTFHDALGLTGIILTRLDGDARGGAACAMREATGIPIRFIGTGEKPDQFEVFHGDRLAGRILGMGDVVSLVEKASEEIALEDAATLEQKLRRAEFDFNDFLQQMRMIKKMGPLENIMAMLPGAPSTPAGGMDDKMLRRTEAIVLSMTAQERARPGILNAKRRLRIANGSGSTLTEVNNLLQRFNQMKKMMKNTGKMRQLMKGGKGGRGGGQALERLMRGG